MNDYGTRENPTTKAGLPTDRTKGHESVRKDIQPSRATGLYVQVIDQANESAPVRYRPVLTDEVVSKIRAGVESGTIKGDLYDTRTGQGWHGIGKYRFIEHQGPVLVIPLEPT